MRLISLLSVKWLLLSTYFQLSSKERLGQLSCLWRFSTLVEESYFTFLHFCCQIVVVQYTGLWDYKQKGWGPHAIFGPEVILYSVNEWHKQEACLILDKLYQPLKLCSFACPRNVLHISVVGSHQWPIEESVFFNLGGKENLRVEMGRAASFLFCKFQASGKLKFVLSFPDISL